jgi:quinol monooxygenase YgiN
MAVDVLDSNVLQVSERWRDQATFGAHMVSDHMVAFNVDMRTARVLRGQINSYHPGGRVSKLIDINTDGKNNLAENAQMVIVMGHAVLAPGEMERLRDAMVAQVTATRDEDGCEHYSFARDVVDPDVLRIAERWRDNASLTAHFGMPHMSVFNAAFSSAKVLSMSVKVYDENGERTLLGE